MDLTLNNQYTGTNKFFNDTKNYGFIIEEETQQEIFYHKTELGGVTPEKGAQVSFVLGENGKGFLAKSIQIVN